MVAAICMRLMQEVMGFKVKRKDNLVLVKLASEEIDNDIIMKETQ